MGKRTITAVAVASIVVAAVVGYCILTVIAPPRWVQRMQLEAAEQKWQRYGGDSYLLTLDRLCPCPDFPRYPVTVQVSKGEIISLVDSDGRAVPLDHELVKYGYRLLTVNGLFDVIRESTPISYQTLVAYDSSLGYPTHISIDWVLMAIDDELYLPMIDVQLTP